MPAKRAAGRKKRQGFFNRKNAEEAALKIGKGVRLKSFRVTSDNGFERQDAVYEFRDINTLRVYSTFLNNPWKEKDSLRVPEGNSAATEKYVSFRFSKGRPSKLVIVMPELEKPVSAVAQKRSPEQEKLISELMPLSYKDIYGSLIVDVVGSVVSSDADCREGGESFFWNSMPTIS